jgi:hypothetical protein
MGKIILHPIHRVQNDKHTISYPLIIGNFYMFMKMLKVTKLVQRINHPTK